jgi:thiol-disulfide isomerase/thioredoxin
MTRALRWVAGTVLLALLLGACRPLATPPTPPPAAETPRDAAPDFTLATLDGRTVRLADLRGRWVLVNFWATWCAPCRDEMPYLEELAGNAPEQLVVLAVNLREEGPVVVQFVETLGLTLPILLQPDDAMLLAYDVRGLPISVLIDPTGRVATRVVGPLTGGVVEAAIR